MGPAQLWSAQSRSGSLGAVVRPPSEARVSTHCATASALACARSHRPRRIRRPASSFSCFHRSACPCVGQASLAVRERGILGSIPRARHLLSCMEVCGRGNRPCCYWSGRPAGAIGAALLSLHLQDMLACVPQSCIPCRSCRGVEDMAEDGDRRMMLTLGQPFVPSDESSVWPTWRDQVHAHLPHLRGLPSLTDGGLIASTRDRGRVCCSIYNSHPPKTNRLWLPPFQL